MAFQLSVQLMALGAQSPGLFQSQLAAAAARQMSQQASNPPPPPTDLQVNARTIIGLLIKATNHPFPYTYIVLEQVHVQARYLPYCHFRSFNRLFSNSSRTSSNTSRISSSSSKRPIWASKEDQRGTALDHRRLLHHLCWEDQG